MSFFENEKRGIFQRGFFGDRSYTFVLYFRACMYLVGRQDVGVYADYDRLCSTDIFWFLAVAADNVGFWPEWQHELECGLQNLAS